MQRENNLFDGDCDGSIKLNVSHIPSIKDVKISRKEITESLPIHMFDLNSLCNNPSICLIGKKASGKSLFIKNLVVNLYGQKKIDECIIISPTERTTPFYSDVADKIYFNYHEKIIEEILEIQCKRIEESKKNGTIPKHVILVLDDCLAQKGSWMRSVSLLNLLFNARHYNISYVMSMQFPLGIAPELRGNFDYIFLFEEDFISSQKRLYDNYAGMFPSFDSFRQVLSNLTDDYGSMVIVNRGIRPTLFDKIFWYKANHESYAATKIPATHLINYDYFVKNTETIKQSGDVKMDDFETLLLNVAKCNDTIIDNINSKTMNDNKLKILETISNCNNTIVKYITANK
jgi:hypothetical protein